MTCKCCKSQGTCRPYCFKKGIHYVNGKMVNRYVIRTYSNKTVIVRTLSENEWYVEMYTYHEDSYVSGILVLNGDNVLETKYTHMDRLYDECDQSISYGLFWFDKYILEDAV